MKHPYDRSYSPPAPALEIAISPPGEVDNSLSVRAMLDTGADGSLIPTHLIGQLGLATVGDLYVVSHWGNRRRAFTYMVDIYVNSLTLPGVFVVGDDFGQQAILGRDVLNRLRLLLDGPAATATLR